MKRPQSQQEGWPLTDHSLGCGPRLSLVVRNTFEGVSEATVSQDSLQGGGHLLEASPAPSSLTFGSVATQTHHPHHRPVGVAEAQDHSAVVWGSLDFEGPGSPN